MLAQESQEGLSREVISQDLRYEQQAHKTSHCRSEEFTVRMMNGGRRVLMRIVLRKDRRENTQGSDRAWSSSLTPPHSPLRAMWVHKQRRSSEMKICELDTVLAHQILGGIPPKVLLCSDEQIPGQASNQGGDASPGRWWGQAITQQQVSSLLAYFI